MLGAPCPQVLAVAQIFLNQEIEIALGGGADGAHMNDRIYAFAMFVTTFQPGK